MKKRKIPLRKCLGCNEQKVKTELIRIVKNKEDGINIDFTGKMNGRGAYICKNIECFEKAIKRKAITRALQYEISDEIYNKLREELTNGE